MWRADIELLLEARRWLQKIPVPKFKNKQLPKLPGTIAPTALMFRQPPSQAIRIEVTTLKRFGFFLNFK